MERKKIIPAIKGTFEYIDEESTKFDKYQIRVDDNILVAFLYMPRKFHLLPKTISFVEELQISIDY